MNISEQLIQVLRLKTETDWFQDRKIQSAYIENPSSFVKSKFPIALWRGLNVHSHHIEILDYYKQKCLEVLTSEYQLNTDQLTLDQFNSVIVNFGNDIKVAPEGIVTFLPSNLPPSFYRNLRPLETNQYLVPYYELQKFYDYYSNPFPQYPVVGATLAGVKLKEVISDLFSRNQILISPNEIHMFISWLQIDYGISSVTVLKQFLTSINLDYNRHLTVTANSIKLFHYKEIYHQVWENQFVINNFNDYFPDAIPELQNIIKSYFTAI